MVILFLNPGERELFDILPTKWNVIWFDNLYMVVQLLRSFRWQGQQINYVVWFFCWFDVLPIKLVATNL